MVADNDLALGKIIATISHSPVLERFRYFSSLKTTLKMETDHVDGHRTVGFAV